MKSKLYNKNFLILIIGQIISLFGSSIQRFALSLYLLDLTGSASVFATILALSMLPIIVISPIAGVLADRGNKKKLMIGLDIISGVLLLIYALIVQQGQDQIWIVGSVMVILSAISTIYQPVVNTCIPIVVDKENLVRGNALIQQVSSLSNFLGPILAGMLYGLFGIMGIVWINIISFLIAAAMELFLDLPHTKSVQKETVGNVFKSDMKESYEYLRYKKPIVFRMLLFSGFYNLFLVPIFSVITPYLIKITFGLPSEAYGIIEGMIALGMIMGGALIAWQPTKFHIKRIHRLLYLSVVGIFVMGLAIGGFRLGHSSVWMSAMIFTLCGMMIMGVLGVANVLSSTYLYREIEPTLLGKILAFGSAFATLCIPLGQIIFGTIIENFALRMDLIVCVCALMVLGNTLLVRWNVLKIEGGCRTK